MRAAVYARVSTHHLDQNPEVQLHELRSYVNSRGWQLTAEIVDHGFSGASSSRPGLIELHSLVRSKKIDCIVVTKLDRLFRSLRQLIATLDEFQSFNCAFVATKEAIDYTSPSGRFFAQILGSLAEFERSLIRERVVAGLKYARDVKGKSLGRPRKANTKLIVELGNQGMLYDRIAELAGCSPSTVSRTLRRRVSKSG